MLMVSEVVDFAFTIVITCTSALYIAYLYHTSISCCEGRLSAPSAQVLNISLQSPAGMKILRSDYNLQLLNKNAMNGAWFPSRAGPANVGLLEPLQHFPRRNPNNMSTARGENRYVKEGERNRMEVDILNKENKSGNIGTERFHDHAYREMLNLKMKH